MTHDPDTRYKAENIVLLDLENVERTTQDYAGPDMRSHCQVILETSLDQEDVYVEGAGPRVDVDVDWAARTALASSRASLR